MLPVLYIMPCFNEIVNSLQSILRHLHQPLAAAMIAQPTRNRPASLGYDLGEFPENSCPKVNLVREFLWLFQAHLVTLWCAEQAHCDLFWGN